MDLVPSTVTSSHLNFNHRQSSKSIIMSQQPSSSNVSIEVNIESGDRIHVVVDRVGDALPHQGWRDFTASVPQDLALNVSSSLVPNYLPPPPPPSPPSQNPNPLPVPINPRPFESRSNPNEERPQSCDPSKGLHFYRNCGHLVKTRIALCSTACLNPRFGPKAPAKRCPICWRRESEESLAMILSSADTMLRVLEANEPWSDGEQADHLHDWICDFVASEECRRDIMRSVYRRYEAQGSFEFQRAVFSRINDEREQRAREQESIQQQQRRVTPLLSYEDLINVGPEEGSYRSFDFLDAQLENEFGVPLPALPAQDVVELVYRDAFYQELLEIAEIRPPHIEGPWPPNPLPLAEGDGHFEEFHRWFEAYRSIRRFYSDFCISGRVYHIAHLRVSRRRARSVLPDIRWETDFDPPDGLIYPQTVTDAIRSSIFVNFEQPTRRDISLSSGVVEIARHLPSIRGELQRLGTAASARLPFYGEMPELTLWNLEADLEEPCLVWDAPIIGDPDCPEEDEDEDEDEDSEADDVTMVTEAPSPSPSEASTVSMHAYVDLTPSHIPEPVSMYVTSRSHILGQTSNESQRAQTSFDLSLYRALSEVEDPDVEMVDNEIPRVGHEDVASIEQQVQFLRHWDEQSNSSGGARRRC